MCVTSCSGSYPVTNGSQCSASCDTAYEVQEDELVCVASCAWPSALYLDEAISSSVKKCAAACPSGKFLSRDDQDCLSTCDYRNGTICEATDDGTNCPKLKFAQISDTFLTCAASCSGSELVFTNGSFQQCVTTCPSAAKYIQTS